MSDADSTISSMTDMVDDMTLTMSEMNIRISDLEYENDSLYNLLLSSQNELALSELYCRFINGYYRFYGLRL